MLSVAPGVRIFVGIEPVDMRGSFDALAGAVRRLGLDPTNGHLYLFFNRRRRLCKMIYFDGSGLCLCGIKLAMSYLVTQIERAADLLAAVDGEHWKQLLAGHWRATDATRLKVLIPKLPGTRNGHLEVYRRDDLVVFQYEPHNGAEVLRDKLAPFSGVLVADAEHRHNAVFADGRMVEAGCNAHGRKKLRDAESVQPGPGLAKEGGAFISAISLAEAEAHKRGRSGEKLQRWRKKKVPPLADDLKAWMDAVEPTLIPSDPLA